MMRRFRQFPQIGGKRGGWVNPYPQNGMLCQYDYRNPSNTDQLWVDLSGNGLDLDITAANIHEDGISSKTVRSNAIHRSFSIPSTPFTIEANCLTYINATNISGQYNSVRHSNLNFFGLFIYHNYAMCHCRRDLNNLEPLVTHGGITGKTVMRYDRSKLTVSCMTSAGSVRSNSANLSNLEAFTTDTIFCNASNETARAGFHLSQFRFYSRALTDSELLTNHALDIT